MFGSRSPLVSSHSPNTCSVRLSGNSDMAMAVNGYLLSVSQQADNLPRFYLASHPTTAVITSTSYEPSF